MAHLLLFKLEYYNKIIEILQQKVKLAFILAYTLHVCETDTKCFASR